MVHEVTPDAADQLGRLAAIYRDSRDACELHNERLQDAIVQALDDGVSVARVARLVGLSTSRIYGIIQRVDSRG